MAGLTKAQQEWIARNNLVASCIVEFVGTMCIVFFGGWAYIQYENDSKAFPWSAVAITQGTVVIAVCLAGQNISGAHYNTAVTLAISGLKRMPTASGIYYLISQVGGSILGAVLIFFLIPSDSDLFKQSTTKLGFPSMNPDYNESVGFFVECIATAVYMYMVMCFGFDKRMPQSVYGISVGLAYMLGILTIGPITGGCLNPARMIGPLLMSLL